MTPLEEFAASWQNLWADIVHVLPRLLLATVLLVLGWALARLVRRLAIRGLRLLRVDALAERSGIEDFLVEGGVRQTAVTLLANLLYWMVVFGVLLAILNSLGMVAARHLLDEVVLYLPRVFAAVIVLMFGTLFARFVRGAAYTYLNNVGIAGARLIAALAQWAVLLFVLSLALEQLAVQSQVLVSAFQFAFGGLCLALALAFGLGGREWAARILDRTFESGGRA